MEKAVTTPEYYPMTLNGLTHACNQKTSRDPVTDYDDDEILAGLDVLREEGLVLRVDSAGSRTAKFRQIIDNKWELSSAEYALLCVLLLRGAQTAGQLRARSERLHAFTDLTSVQDTLEAMAQRDIEPFQLVETLERLPGTKEIRYRHCIGLHPVSEPAAVSTGFTPPEDAGPSGSPGAPDTPRIPISERVAILEQHIRDLEERVLRTEEEFRTFKSQFE